MAAPAWPELEIRLAVVAPEKLASALPATNTLANFGRQGAANDQQQDFREATSSPSATLHSAWCGGGDSAGCNACPSLTGR